MRTIAEIREKAGTAARARATKAGKAPRWAYEHYFVQAEGLRSRVHMQNFWSTFWPQVDEPATATIMLRDDGGRELGTITRTLPRFGSLFLEIDDALREVGATATEGTVAIDLEPPPGVRAEFGDLPKPTEVEVKTPFWMAYYDGSDSFMYVHSIDTMAGKVFGASPLIAWSLTRTVGEGAPWRSWRLLEVDRLTDLHVVAINHSPEPRASTVGIYTADDAITLYSERVELAPRALKRVRVPREALERFRAEHTELPHVRLGMDPLMTGNGKPYVIMRYADGPPSVHHG